MRSSQAANSDDTRESEKTTSGLNVFIKRISWINWRSRVLIPSEKPLVAAVNLKSIAPSFVTLKFMGTAPKVGR